MTWNENGPFPHVKQIYSKAGWWLDRVVLSRNGRFQSSPPSRAGRRESWKSEARPPYSLLKESIVCFPTSFVLNSCRNKPHQRCQRLSSAFRFKAKFLAATSLSSSRNPNAPSGSHRVTTSSYQVFLLQIKVLQCLSQGQLHSSRVCLDSWTSYLLRSALEL